MIEASPGVPPHIALLLNEDIDLSDFRRAARGVKGMLRDLKKQALPGESNLAVAPLEGEGVREFRAVMNGGLDLFGNSGACQMLACRVGYADQIARSIALMSDKVSMHDHLYEKIIDLRSRPSNEEVAPLVSDIVVLKRIKPLIEAGILSFSSPVIAACSSCKQEFDSRVEALAEGVLQAFGDQMSVERGAGEAAIDLGPLYDPSVVYRLSPTYSKTADEDMKRDFIQSAVRSVLWDARTAGWVQGSLFSNSKAAVSSLLAEDGLRLPSTEFQTFSAERTASLPWVAGLTVEQTIELRQDAQHALPALRQFMARRLSKFDADTAENWRDCVAELREQAEEVRSELAIATSRSRSFHRNATGIFGMSVSAVCLAVGGPVAGLGGLLSTLGLIHSMSPSESADTQRLMVKPGYVLVAAEDILHHARAS